MTQSWSLASTLFGIFLVLLLSQSFSTSTDVVVRRLGLNTTDGKTCISRLSWTVVSRSQQVTAGHRTTTQLVWSFWRPTSVALLRTTSCPALLGLKVKSRGTNFCYWSVLADLFPLTVNFFFSSCCQVRWGIHDPSKMIPKGPMITRLLMTQFSWRHCRMDTSLCEQDRKTTVEGFFCKLFEAFRGGMGWGTMKGSVFTNVLQVSAKRKSLASCQLYVKEE